MITLEFEILPKEGGVMGSVIPKVEGEVPSELLSNVMAMVARSDPTAEIIVQGKCIAFSSGLPFTTVHTMAQQIKAGSWEELKGVEVVVTCLRTQRVVISANFDLEMDALIEHLEGRVAL